MVALCIDEPNAIIFFGVACLSQVLLRPIVTLVTPWTCILFFAPWISHLDKLCTITEFDSTQNRKCVAIRHANLIRVLVTSSPDEASDSDHPIVVQLFCKVVP